MLTERILFICNAKCLSYAEFTWEKNEAMFKPHLKSLLYKYYDNVCLVNTIRKTIQVNNEKKENKD